MQCGSNDLDLKTFRKWSLVHNFLIQAFTAFRTSLRRMPGCSLECLHLGSKQCMLSTY